MLSPKKETITNWYISVNNAHTNEVVSKRLGVSDGTVDDSVLMLYNKDYNEIRCYKVPDFKTVREFIDSTAQFNLSFNIYSRKGDTGPVSDSFFKMLKKRKRNKKRVSDPRKTSGVTTASKT